MSVAELFQPVPFTWGLRGDPYLWQEMQETLASTPCPDDVQSLEKLVCEKFEILTGSRMLGDERIYVERLARGGMSSGHVSTRFWIERAVPLLCARLDRESQRKPKCHISLYEQGIYTRGELIFALVGLAESQEPAAFMPDVPADFASSMRSVVKNLPQSADSFASLMDSGAPSRPAHAIALATAAHERAFRAHCSLHRYFFGNARL